MDVFNLDWMIGLAFTSVHFTEPCHWSFAIDASCVAAECPWRILNGGRIALSNDDHRQQFGLPAPIDAPSSATSLLAGKTIVAVHIREGTADLSIDMQDELRIEFIPFSSGYESWQIVSPNGSHVIAMGGGELAGYVSPV